MDDTWNCWRVWSQASRCSAGAFEVVSSTFTAFAVISDLIELLLSLERTGESIVDLINLCLFACL